MGCNVNTNSDSTSIDLIKYLPDIYKEKDQYRHLEDFLRPMSLTSEEIRESIRNWAPEFDVEDCDDANLNHLGNLYGYRPRTSVPNLEGKRRKIRYVMDLWERKGTARAYYLAGIEIDIPTFGLTDNRFTVLSLSHQGRLSTVDEAYLQDNIFHHEGVLILETGSYIHPQLFFEVFLEFLPGGFLLYIAQTVHQGIAVVDPPIQPWELQFSESHIFKDARYSPPIMAEPRWWKEVNLASEGVFLSDGLYLHDSVGYGLSDYLLPFDPQRFPNLPNGFVIPDGYRGPFGHIPGRPLNLSELNYPTTDPRLYDHEVDAIRDITTTDLCRVMCFFGIEKHPTLFDTWSRPDGDSQPYIIKVGVDQRVDEHTHWLFPGLEGDMSGQIIEYDGENWSYTNLTGADYSMDCYGNIYNDSTTPIYTDSTCVQDATGDVFIEALPATSLNRFTMTVMQDLRIDKSSPLSLPGDMTGKVIEWDGTTFHYSCVPSMNPPCTDSTTIMCIGPCKCHCGTGGTGITGDTGGSGGTGGTGSRGNTGSTGGQGTGLWSEDIYGAYWDEYTTGTTGGAGITGSYLHTQSSPSITWNLNHNLSTLTPVIICYDINDEVVFPKNITIIDSNNCTVEFYGVESGHASAINPHAEHNQGTLSSVWTAVHNLGIDYPIVECFDTSGESIVPLSVENIDSNTVRITFPSPKIGDSVFLGPEYEHNQTTPSLVWNVNHNLLSTYPLVECWSSSGEIIEPTKIEVIDSNNIQIEFLSPESGIATVSSSGGIMIPTTFDGTVRVGGSGGTGSGTRFIVDDGPIWIESIPLSNKNGYGNSFTEQLGETVSFGDVLKYETDGKLYKETGSDSTTAPVAIALSDGVVDDYIEVLSSGFIRNDSWNFIEGEELFTSLVTPGEMDTTGALHVGFVTDSTNIIHFSPMYGEGSLISSGRGRYESSLLTGATGYSGTHGLGVKPMLKVYDDSWNKVRPSVTIVSDNDYFIELDEDITSVYVICIA